MAHDYETITYAEDGPVAWVTLDRPEVYNAFNRKMQEELRDVWRSLRANHDINAAVLTASGDKAFCTGVDRKENASPEAVEAVLSATSNKFMYDDPGDDLGPKACDLWKPVVCAVNGMACGGAFYMLSEVDVIIAAEHATFFDPHVTYGMAAVYEPMQMLQKMPLGEILRLSLLGNYERLSAQRAYEIGLVSEVTRADELAARAKWVADAIASQPPLAVQATLRSIWYANEVTRSQAIAMGPALLGVGNDPSSMAQGQAAFTSGQRIEPRIR